MSPDTEMFAAMLCFGFAIFYFLFQVLRLMFPTWAWKFEKNGPEAIHALSVSEVHTAQSLRKANPTQGCFARLVHSENLTDEERVFKRKLQQMLFLAAGAGVLIYYVRFSPDLPDMADSYATDFLIIALGMCFSALANYRIFRTMRCVMGADNLPLPNPKDFKKEPWDNSV